MVFSQRKITHQAQPVDWALGNFFEEKLQQPAKI
jgi:hypothetical protein